MQLQLERQQVNAARQNLERFPRRPTQSQTLREAHTSNFGTSTILLNASPVLIQPTNNTSSTPSQGHNSQFLLSSKRFPCYILPTLNTCCVIGLLEEVSLNSTASEERQERCSFVQELVLSSMSSEREEESCEKKFNALIESSRTVERDSVDDDDDEEEFTPRRLTSTVLRGRARQDNQNAKRRAEANRKDQNKDSESDENR